MKISKIKSLCRKNPQVAFDCIRKNTLAELPNHIVYPAVKKLIWRDYIIGFDKYPVIVQCENYYDFEIQIEEKYLELLPDLIKKEQIVLMLS